MSINGRKEGNALSKGALNTFIFTVIWRHTYVKRIFRSHPISHCTMSCSFITDISSLTMSTLTPVYRCTEYLPVQFVYAHPISHCVQCPVVLSQISPVSQCPHLHQSTDARNTYLYSLVTSTLFHTVYNVL